MWPLGWWTEEGEEKREESRRIYEESDSKECIHIDIFVESYTNIIGNYHESLKKEKKVSVICNADDKKLAHIN